MKNLSGISPKNKAIIQLLLCSAMWSMGGIIIKQLPWNAFVIAGLRSLLGGSVVLAFMRIAGKKLILNKKSALSGVSLWLTMELFVSANKLTTAANAIVLQFTAPIFVVIISVIFLKKKMVRADVIAAVLTLGGISLFFFDQLSSGHVWGNIIAIGSGVTFGTYYVTLGSSEEQERMSAIVIANALTFLVSLPFIFITRPQVSLMPALYILILGIFQLGLPYVLLSVASGKCPPLACSLLGALEPLLNPVWVFLFDGEAPGLFALFGGVIVIATITIWCVYGSRAEKRAAVGAANEQ